MDNTEKKVWGIHTLDDNLFLKKCIIAIGWSEMDDLTQIPADREAFKAKYIETYPDAKPGSIPTSSGMLYRFCNEIQPGDIIIYPSKSDRMINIGEVTGEYKYVQEQGEYVHTRTVKWLKRFPRMDFTQGALYEIGSAMTLFSVKNYADEFLDALNGKKGGTGGGVDITIGATAEEILENTKDYVLKELSRNLKGYDLEGFVASLLQAMGYRTTVSQQGGDSGIDIVAYKDELPPRIAVQVKSQDGDIKETTIQSLKGAMMPGDYGLFVTLSNYTRNAKKFLDKNPMIRGINGAELADLVLKYYEALDDRYRMMIPLKKVYIPMPKSIMEA